jgi:glutaredoxin-like protein
MTEHQRGSLLSEKDRNEISFILNKGLAKSTSTIELLTFRPPATEQCEYCDTIEQLYSEVAALSAGRIVTRSMSFEESKDLAQKYQVKRAPATVLTVQDAGKSFGDSKEPALKFYGLASGYEFSALLEDIIDVASHEPSNLSVNSVEKMKGLKSKVHIQVFVTPTCPYCPKAVRTAHMLSMANPEMVDAEMIEASEFPELSEKYSVMAVPKIVINESTEFEGALPEQAFVSKIHEALSAKN